MYPFNILDIKIFIANGQYNINRIISLFYKKRGIN